ncbi:hypothetical protein Ancab_023648, partial [Ancistrocladus abbreviatus]
MKNAYGNCATDLETIERDLAKVVRWSTIGNYREAENYACQAHGDLSRGSCILVLEFDKLPSDLHWGLT